MVFLPFWLFVFLAVLILASIAAMSARSGSLLAGTYSIEVWQLTGIMLLLGLARARRSPAAAIPCRILHGADGAHCQSASSDIRAQNDNSKAEISSKPNRL